MGCFPFKKHHQGVPSENTPLNDPGHPPSSSIYDYIRRMNPHNILAFGVCKMQAVLASRPAVAGRNPPGIGITSPQAGVHCPGRQAKDFGGFFSGAQREAIHLALHDSSKDLQTRTFHQNMKNITKIRLQKSQTRNFFKTSEIEISKINGISQLKWACIFC